MCNVLETNTDLVVIFMHGEDVKYSNLRTILLYIETLRFTHNSL